MGSEAELATELSARFAARVVILYGSYARGSAGPSSDVDVVCFCDGSERFPATFRWHGALIDAWVHPLEDADSSANFRKLHDGRVTRDEDGRGQRLLERVAMELRAPREMLGARQAEHLRVWLWKMFDRAARGGLGGDHRRRWLLHELPEAWCDLAGRHFLGAELVFDAMREAAPEVYAAYAAAVVPSASLTELELVVELIAGLRRGDE